MESHNQIPEVLASHRNARLTFQGRLLLVQRVRQEGWAVAHAAKAMGISRKCAHYWLKRYDQEGEDGVACHRHGTGVAGFLPRSWDHLDSQSWDRPACLAGGALDGSLDRRVRVVDAEAGGRGIQGGQRG